MNCFIVVVVEVLSLADIMTVVPLPNRGQSSHEAIRFKIHGLQSQPGTCGKLLEVVCQPDDPHPAATTQTWVDHLNQQIQSKALIRVLACLTELCVAWLAN